MPVNKDSASEGYRCKGGLSFRCNHGPYKVWGESWETHYRHENYYYCRNCRAYMGCEKCAQLPQELICLKCHDWALAEGEQEHGKMLNKELILEKWKALAQRVLGNMKHV